MSAVTAILVVIALAAGFGVALAWEHRRRQRALRGPERVRRIAFPFTGEGLSEQALAAALRLARAEKATLMPVYLALVPLRLSVDVPLQSECDVALPMLETIERRAARAEVPVDSRIERGRTVRHALRELAAHERFDRIVVAAGADSSDEGFTPEAVAWLLTNVPGEVIVMRTAESGPAGAKDLGAGEAAAGMAAGVGETAAGVTTGAGETAPGETAAAGAHKELQPKQAVSPQPPSA